MTVVYAQEVATERIGGFFRLLFRWRGSIYHAIYGEMIIFLILYYCLNFSYHLMPDVAQVRFAKFCKSCEDFADYIPVTFIVGFFTVRTLARRWTQWENIPWPDKCAFNISGSLHGSDASARMLRRSLVRYVNLGSILCFRDISIPVKKRFPTLEYLVVAGLMTSKEQEMFEKTKCPMDTNWWIPFHWAFTLAEKVAQEGRIDQSQMNKIREDILDLRQKCWVLFSHDWISLPMVYTQVVTLAVYLFMLACLFGRQNFNNPFLPIKNETLAAIGGQTDNENSHTEMFFPFFTVFQVMFYLGWLKVAEIIICPTGADADDFEMNYIIDRNLRMSYTVVDYSYNKIPPVEKDIHWDQEEPSLPYTQSSAKAGTGAFIGSAANLNVTSKQAALTEDSLPTMGIGAIPNIQMAPSRQTSVTRPPNVTHSDSIKSERPTMRNPLNRLISKENEYLDGIKPTTTPAPESTQAKPAKSTKKKDPETAEVSMQKLTKYDEEQPVTVAHQQQQLSKIDEQSEVLIKLLPDTDEEKSPKKTDQPKFGLAEMPPPKPPRNPLIHQISSSDDGRPRPPLPHQQRPVPDAEDPPLSVKDVQSLL